ncbi:hypothetical protein ANN_08537 [Periplaneta americana]|uniref:Uncharacterized protein n=1 Tax=Periplaneta americana TaxID=6978 RepID=A0ABQ8T1R0_PERAM|nr:hypothetical protein ANN_08537 [Periplaneta americana]
MAGLCEGGNEPSGLEKPFKVRVAGTRSQDGEQSHTKALLDALPVEEGKVGRPKLRWLDDVQADLTKVGIEKMENTSIRQE